jgi:site-specific DNA-methyltransferase (adenine-specific)
LTEDIKNNGLIEHIWIYEDKILDGRNRYLACIAAEIEPKFREYKGDGLDALKFVLSLNLQRRQLDASQRACVAQDVMPMYEKAAKERQRTLNNASGINSRSENKGNSRDFVAYEFNVNSHYIQDAKLVKAESPTLFDEVKAGLIHLKEAVNTIKKDKREAGRAEIAAAGAKVKPSDKWHVYHGDITTWKAPRQYDFIITDPPYPKEFLPLWEVLAERANEWLKDGGLLIAMSGQSYLDEIYAIMSKHMDYYWTATYLTPGQPTPLRQVNVNSTWKPLLIYSKGKYKGKIFGDVFVSPGNDKENHKWGQSEGGMFDIISKICLPGQYILDPFCGAGTTLLAGLKHGCLCDGLELDIENVNISKGRLSE